MLAQFAPGFLFLALESSAIALVFAISISRPILAIRLAVGASTLHINSSAYFEFGGFDVSFFGIVLVVAFVSAFAVVNMAVWIRQRGRSAA